MTRPSMDDPCGFWLMERLEPSYVEEFWGDCGTPEVETSWSCYQCRLYGFEGEEHGPWHDDGTPCSWTHDKWQHGGEHAAPRHA